MRKTSLLLMFAFCLGTLSFSDDAMAARNARAKAKAKGLSNVCATVKVLTNQLLYKAAISHHISPGDQRAAGPTLICNKDCPKKFPAQLFYSDGTLAAKLGYYGRWNVTGKSRAYCAAGGAPACSNSTISRNARSSRRDGKGYLQVSSASTGKSTVCYRINNLTGRNGSPT